MGIVPNDRVSTEGRQLQTLRITRIGFRAGAAPGREPLVIEPSTVVVVVGPNNSGKSLALREITTWCVGEDQPRQVIDTLAVDFPPDFETALSLLDPFVWASSVHQIQRGDANEDRDFELQKPKQSTGDSNIGDRIWESQIRHAIEQADEVNLRRYFSRFHVIRLDGHTRFALTDQQQGGNLAGKPINHLHALAMDNAKRSALRAETASAFGLYFVLDFLNLGSTYVRMSPREPEDPDEELALTPRAQEFIRAATRIEQFGDGLRCYVGLLAATQGLPHRIILVDEPEAFLHPPLARQLGAALATLARNRDGSLVVATHSSDFVLGCVLSGADTTIVRLTYERGVATARQLPALRVRELAQDPFLRSTEVLRALFHRGAVVCESDTDRAVYDEMNRRLLEDHRGLRDVLFLNTQGSSSIRRVVDPLRRLGVPAAAIVDLDTVKPESRSWHPLLEACGIPEEERRQLEPIRTQLLQAFAAVPRAVGDPDPMKRPGIAALNANDRAQAQVFLAALAAYGLFLVPVGELESWLPHVGAVGQKAAWVTSLFDRIGTSPGAPDYLLPGANDIWTFIDGIGAWISNPTRRGMP